MLRGDYDELHIQANDANLSGVLNGCLDLKELIGSGIQMTCTALNPLGVSSF